MNFSRLMLGTVQFGMNYGVANTHGKPDFSTVKHLLRAAFDGGVNALDTAPEYGDSEEVIGRALAESGLSSKIRIVTKIPKIPDDGDPERFIEMSLKSSLSRLGVGVLSAALLHEESDVRYLDILDGMRKKGLIEAAGVSLNSLAYRDAGAAAACLQLPCSILDHRFDSRFGRGNCHCFIRGAYMQGMLLMPMEKIFVTEVAEKRRELEKLGIPMAELCLRYLFSLPGSNSVLTGVETMEQLRENLRLSQLPPLPEDLLAKIREVTLPMEISSV